jgi:acyl-CoA thioester hydrolase
MMRSGILWPVADVSVRYLRPLTLNQEVLVTACLREWELRIVIDYKIEDANGVLFTKARTVQVPVEERSRDLMLGSPQELIDNVVRQLDAAGIGVDRG